MGLLLGVICALQAVAIFGSNNPSGWVNEFQALIGAFVAVVAAALTLSVTMLVEVARRRDRQQAARALLPFSLKEIANYSKDTLIKLAELMPDEDRGNHADVVKGEFLGNELPQKAIQTISDVVETAEPEVRRGLIDLLVCLQVYASRLREIDSRNPNRNSNNITVADLRCRIPEQLEIYAHTLRCVRYGRFEVDTIPHGPVLRHELELAAMICKFEKKNVGTWSAIEAFFHARWRSKNS